MKTKQAKEEMDWICKVPDTDNDVVFVYVLTAEVIQEYCQEIEHPPLTDQDLERVAKQLEKLIEESVWKKGLMNTALKRAHVDRKVIPLRDDG